MNIASMRAELLADSHSLASDADVNRLIVKALRFHAGRRLWFSEASFSFTLVQGKAAYGLGDGPPTDLKEVVGKTLWVLTAGSQDSRFPCERVPSADFERVKLYGVSQSQPARWDFWANQLRFYPVPNSSTDVIEGRYVRDVSYPVTKYEGGAFVFYTQDGLRKLSTTEFDGWTNDWTSATGAGHMVQARALYLLYKDVLHDTDSANDALNTWLELSAKLDDETDQKTAGGTEIVGTILGDSYYAW